MNSIVLDPTIEKKFRNYNELSIKEKAQLGCYWLNDEPDYLNKEYLAKQPLANFYSHPFGLKSLNEKNDSLRFLGRDGITDLSVDAMREWLKNHKKFIKGLRIIYAEAENNSKHHFVYFEASGFETVLCGGCTDFSGSGNYGRRQLECMFFYIAEQLKLPIETATIPAIIYAKVGGKLPS